MLPELEFELKKTPHVNLIMPGRKCLHCGCTAGGVATLRARKHAQALLCATTAAESHSGRAWVPCEVACTRRPCCAPPR